MPPTEDPGALVEEAVRRCLHLAGTWIGWDGRPLVGDDGARIYTPHKAVRRLADHLVNHLAQIECLLAGVPSADDDWAGSLVTFDSDWARFTEADLREARGRLTRLARTFSLRLTAAGPEEWDRSRGDAWTLREIAEHVADTYYADQVGDLRQSR